MMNVLRRALVAATIAFSAEMAVADGLQDGLTAAQAGDAIAQSNLGVMYFKGSGVPPDIVTAHMWLNIANANGSEPAAGMRARLERQMTPAEISGASRRAKLCMASSYADCD